MQLSIIFPNGLRIEFSEDGEVVECEPIATVDAVKVLKCSDKVAIKQSYVRPPPKPAPAMGDHPVNFYEAPVTPKEPEPPAPGRNKYGRWDNDVPPDVDAEILRLRNKGLTMRGISNELARQGVTMDYPRVRGRLSAIVRRQNKKGAIAEVNSEVTSEVTKEATSSTNASINESNVRNVSDVRPKAENVAERSPTEENVDPEAKPYTRAVLNGLIWDLHKEGKSNEEISDELYKQGYCFSEDFVRERLKKIEGGRA